LLRHQGVLASEADARARRLVLEADSSGSFEPKVPKKLVLVPVGLEQRDRFDQVNSPEPATDQLLRALHRCAKRKRLFDIAFSVLVLVTVASWLFPACALMIKLDSAGPVFFRQKRVGQGGRVFTCLKFRTMRHDPRAAFVQAAKNDPRVTRAGRWLRRTNLDEFPQFLNVLMGEMSTVGPRPHVPELDAIHVSAVQGYGMRTLVKPGVTGLAQVSGCRGETRDVRDMSHRVKFDNFYIRRMSLKFDVNIIGLTIVRLLQGDTQAY
jgi:lipopolysaccharide/colanic/teichoic acid biosynthesis glycosyltransferase